jgi:hypothetical protein
MTDGLRPTIAVPIGPLALKPPKAEAHKMTAACRLVTITWLQIAAAER